MPKSYDVLTDTAVATCCGEVYTVLALPQEVFMLEMVCWLAALGLPCRLQLGFFLQVE
jgi:hypothetical protein